MKNITNRIHDTLNSRLDQLKLNMLAHKGGRPYIESRLWRAPNESDLSWDGLNRVSMNTTAGRKQRAALINDAGRVVNKISQYMFKNKVDRSGIDEFWSMNVDGTGTSVHQFWIEVSEALTTCQWLWIQLDRLPALTNEDGSVRNRTLLEKMKDGDFVRLKMWPSTTVPDWCIGENGSLLWIITEGAKYDNTDPMKAAESYKVRTLWVKKQDGIYVTQYKVDDKDEDTLLKAEVKISDMDELPFVLVGTPNSDPWWFDDVEMIQAQLMNMDSLHYENLSRAVFPQLIIPQSTLESLEAKLVERVGQNNGQRVVELIREIVRGLDTPIVESGDDKGITRFITPNASDLASLPSEIMRKRQLLFDMVGLSLFNKETRQMQTAESKQFDQLDTESTLKHRSIILQEVETKVVLMAKKIDPMFVEYKPVWPMSFDVVDAITDMNTIALVGNMPDVTPAMRKISLMCALRVLENVGGADDELLEDARKEISNLKDTDLPDIKDITDGLANDTTTPQDAPAPN